MLSRDVRRRWMQYGQNRVEVKGKVCEFCGKPAEEVDHIEPVGARPRQPSDFGPYIEKMFLNKCRPLCSKCNKERRKKK